MLPKTKKRICRGLKYFCIGTLIYFAFSPNETTLGWLFIFIVGVIEINDYYAVKRIDVINALVIDTFKGILEINTARGEVLDGIIDTMNRIDTMLEARLKRGDNGQKQPQENS